ncbi:MAG: DUF1735 domain-containing protein [Bacteroidales bacterium]|nr:DUF1735 domain-containing protein [Bacteroidales bacterium]
MKKRLFFAKKIRNVVVLCGVAGLFPSCNSDVDFGEQYKKTIYLVHGQNLLYTKEHRYGTENDKLVFSVYCASSEPITASVSVLLQIDGHALDSLNARGLLENEAYVDREILPNGSYTFPAEAQVTIPAGQQYALLEVPFYPEGLNSDVAYTLPVTIVSNSRNYDLSPEARSLVYEVKMINKYSGDFVGTSADPSAVRPVQPVLKAISVNQVRLPIHNLEAEEQQYLDSHFMLLTIAEDGKVAIAPWSNAKIADLGGNFYDEVQQSYELHYRYTDDNGDIFTVTEKIANVNAPKIVQ